MVASEAPRSRMPIQRCGDSKGKRSRTSTRRTVAIDGRRIGVNLEDEFWHALREIAVAKGMTRPGVIKEIDQTRSNANFSSAIRLFVLAHYRGLQR